MLSPFTHLIVGYFEMELVTAADVAVRSIGIFGEAGCSERNACITIENQSIPVMFRLSG